MGPEQLRHDPEKLVNVDASGARGVVVGPNAVQHNAFVFYGEQAGQPPPADLRQYLERLAEHHRWLELQDIREAGSLRIELEKVYVALKAEPESEYDLRHQARLHDVEVREAAGGRALDSISPEKLAALDAENVRRAHQPRRDQAKRERVTELRTIADVVRQHRRLVLLGGPGSGKTTLGQWLALQTARALLRQLPEEVATAPGSGPADAARVYVRSGSTFHFRAAHFGAEGAETEPITITAVPARGTLAFARSPVVAGQRLVIPVEHVDRLTFTPAGRECGVDYARLHFSAPGQPDGLLVIDVGQHVLVPLSQVDPDRGDAEDAGPPADLGPARVPILLRLAYYAAELATREREGRPALALAHYLGQDLDSQSWYGGSPEARNALLRGCLADQRALVILDGLDELPEGNRRTVLLRVQEFIEEFTAPNDPGGPGAPTREGGNQVVVTSRYVGYKLMPVQGRCAHFGIQPMRRPAVEQFVRSWTAAVNAELAGDAQPVFAAGALIAEIYDDARPAIRELATNPLLVTILATVYWADGRLPEQRAGVYDRVVENLLSIWLRRPECLAQQLKRETLLAALEPLAADLQDNERENGLVSLSRIGELIEKPLAAMHRSAPDDRSFRPMLDALLTTIRKQVGLLAEQSAGNYAFFHRTFQEFLAARHLLADRDDAAVRLIERLDDPRWREPLLLALGFAMVSDAWGPEARTRLLTDVVAVDERDPQIPHASMLVIHALPDLREVPKQLVGRLIVQLLRSYTLGQGQPQAAGLREGICDAFVRLRTGPRADVVAEVLAEAIRQPVDGQDVSGAAAEVLLRIGWFTTGMIEALLYAVPRDRSELGWPIRWALLGALGGAPAPAVIMPRLPMRRMLEGHPELAGFVRDDVDWLWLLVALYGGLGRGQSKERTQDYQLRRLRQVQSAPGRPGSQSPGPPPPAPWVEFGAEYIVHDLAATDLSRAIRRQLQSRRPAAGLAGTLRQCWETGATPAVRAEGLTGLAALGEDVVPLVRAALADRDRRAVAHTADRDRRAAAHAAIERLRWLRALTREAIAPCAEVAARTLPETAPEEHQLDLLRLVIDARITAGGGPLAVSDAVPGLRYVDATSGPVREALAAEHWSYLFSGLTAEPPTEVWAAVEAGTGVSGTATGPLGRGWSALPQARNNLSWPRLPWPQPALAPPATTPVARYLAMLDALSTAPAEHDHLAGFLLGRSRSFLDDHPALLWETLAVCLLRGRTFRTGYLAGATGGRAFVSAYSAVSAEVVAGWAPGREVALRSVLAEVFIPHEDVPWDAPIPWESMLVLLNGAARIDDAYQRFRALWWLANAVSAAHLARLDLDLLGLAKRIKDPHERARALEWMLLSGGPDGLGFGGIPELDGLDRALRQIRDPEHRARAQARLAFLIPEQLPERFDDAVSSAADIADPPRRAETILELRSAAGAAPDLTPRLDAVAAAMPGAWLRHKALGQGSRLVATYRPHYRAGVLSWRLPPESAPPGGAVARLPAPTGQLAWGLLYLAATAAEVEATEATSTGDSDYWDLLAGADPQAGVDSLLGSAVDGAIRVTAREAAVLNRIVRAGRPAVLAPLWPALECADPAALAMITRWSTDDPATLGWRALVQAENGQLTPEIVDRVVEVLVTSTDRHWLRAALALHGVTPHNRNRNRRWSVRRVGRATLETLARHATRIDYSPAVLSALSWVRSDIHHDDAAALTAWLEQATADQGSPATWILESMESIDSELVAILPQALATAPPPLQRTLMAAVCRLAHCFMAFDSSAEAIRESLATIPQNVRREVHAIRDGSTIYLTAAQQAVEAPDDGARLDAARQVLDAATVWLDDTCLLDAKTCLQRLKEIGNGYYLPLWPNSYWDKAGEAAGKVAEPEEVLRLLVTMVEASGTNDDLDQVGNLLTATYALARLSPHVFAAAAEPDMWEPLLTEWAVTAEHWNIRLAAVRLLGLLRRVTDRVAEALRAAMTDVSFVQQAAYESVEEFRRLEGDVIPELLTLLDDESAAVAAATARLLVSVANTEGAATDRRRILHGLRAAGAGRRAFRFVFLMRDLAEGERMRIEPVDRLSRLLDRAIFSVSGL